MNRLQLTLAILKPHVLLDPFAIQWIRKLILDSNFKVIRSKRKKMSQEITEKFYEEHKGRFFYNRLTGLMTSGPSDLYVLAKENAILDWRKMLGTTKVYKAQFEDPDSIRGRFGLSDTRNVAHGSDSPDSARREISIIFPEFDIDHWFSKEEEHFRNGNVQFSEQDFVHFNIPQKFV